MIASKITNGILYMIATDKQPFSMIEDDGFKKFLSIVASIYCIMSKNYHKAAR